MFFFIGSISSPIRWVAVNRSPTVIFPRVGGERRTVPATRIACSCSRWSLFYAAFIKLRKMTKLQLLHRALNERLMAAVEQIMEMVGGTVLEYEEETIRVRKENEVLRRRLRWMEGANSADWPGITTVGD